MRDIELGLGGYSPAPHADRRELLEDEGARRRLLQELDRAGVRLAALNASGNALERAEDDAALRDAIRLAPLLGVDRVVCMSGGAPALSGGGWFPGIEDAIEREWTTRVLPYWDEVAALARSEDPRLRLCLELEPGAAVYNVSTFERLAALGDNLCVNLDPSHFFFQLVDPLAVIARLGKRIAFAHGKDARFHSSRVALDGVLQRHLEPTWEYATVGHGHDGAWWGEFVAALAAAGYSGVVSIEWEDARVAPETSVLEAARLLGAASAPAPPSEAVTA
ncbi:MAG: sugar phosphate isomerase/epimerase [Thermoleophilia bacterium]|nr:sugar phosphate isomerase/epimerase [Thermoleophilia bacterium]